MKSATLPDGFFLGQVPPNWTEYLQNGTWSDAHNNRVKVRIPGKHSKGPEILDKDLPWAIVSQSTSAGNRNGASTGLSGGEWVIGFYLDEDEQLPVIMQVLGKNEVSGAKIKASKNGTTQFENVSRFAGQVAQAHQMGGGKPPKAPAAPDKKDFEKAKQSLSSPPALPEEATDGLRFKSPEEWWEGVQAAGGRIKNFFDPSSEQSNEPTVRVGERTPTTGGITQPSIPSRDQDGNVYGQQ